MRYGDEVAVCYDGKWGRRVKGRVLCGKKGTMILVEFQQRGEETILQHWFRRRRGGKNTLGGKQYYFGGFVPVDGSLMRSLFGTPGDWYSVWKWEE